MSTVLWATLYSGLACGRGEEVANLATNGGTDAG